MEKYLPSIIRSYKSRISQLSDIRHFQYIYIARYAKCIFCVSINLSNFVRQISIIFIYVIVTREWKHSEFLSLNFIIPVFVRLVIEIISISKRQVKSDVAETHDVSCGRQKGQRERVIYIDKIKYSFFVHMDAVCVPINTIWFIPKNKPSHLGRAESSLWHDRVETSILLRLKEIYIGISRKSLSFTNASLALNTGVNWIVPIHVRKLFFF